jgi:hypothetical protein
VAKVDTVGLDTISPHSSSSSTGAVKRSTCGAEGARPLHGSSGDAVVLVNGGDIKCVTAGVSSVIGRSRTCFAGSGVCDVRSNDTARTPCCCALTTVGSMGAMGEDVERNPGLSCCQGSLEADAELQLNAAGVSVDKGGMLSRVEGLVPVVAIDDRWRICAPVMTCSTGAGESQ